LNWPRVKRVWFSAITVDTFDIDITGLMLERAISQLLDKLGISWRDLMDGLKGLRGLAWLETFKDIKEEVETAVRDQLAGKIVALRGSWSENVFFANKLGKISFAAVSEERDRFVRGKLKDLLSVTNKVLFDYKRSVEVWEGTPIVRFTRNMDDEEVEVGVRAPFAKYGRAYRVWMRVNDVHMYPSKPFGTKFTNAYVWRAYHTEGWKQKLEKIFEYCRNREKKAVKIVKAARRMDAGEVRQDLIDSAELSEDEIDDFLEDWVGESLWDLVESVSKINRTAALAILKNRGLLNEQ